MLLKIKAILSGLATYIPGYQFMDATGGTGSARYCYSVWLRHLTLAHKSGLVKKQIRNLAELGPGDSIGIGLAALLSGAENYYALDLVPYADISKNLDLFKELVVLFRNRTDIPADNEFPGVNPKLDTYKFPHSILAGEKLNRFLDESRIEKIKKSIESPDQANSMVHYITPWNDPAVIKQSSMDMIYSQAVLEHIDDLQGCYMAMKRWLNPDGFMSHQVDFRCHGTADPWNGHWTYSNTLWKIVVGKRPYLLNREPHSKHIHLLKNNGFRVVNDYCVRSESRLKKIDLANRYRDITDDDLTISGALIQSVLS